MLSRFTHLQALRASGQDESALGPDHCVVKDEAASFNNSLLARNSCG
jgi:hypothetical protein